MAEKRKICSFCGKTGHNCRSHPYVTSNKCSTCGSYGHKAPTCGEKILKTDVKSALPLPSDFSLRRGSTSALSQEEIEMATRVLIGCSQEAANCKHESTSVVERSSALTGLNRKTMLNIRTSLLNGEVPQAVESVRGQYLRAPPHRDLLTKINDTIDKLHAVGTMSSSTKIAKGLNFHHGILISTRHLTTILHKIGYSYVAPSPSNILLARESECMRKVRLAYLRKVATLRKDHEIVYIDESYVNENHHQKKCWIRKGSKVYIPAGKGPRYILYGAGSRNGWLGKPIVFKNKSDNQDYHSGMNASHFEELFQETCRLGKEQLGRCAFVLDNASYHKRLQDERCRISFWNSKKAAEVKEAWACGEVPGQENYEGPPLVYKKQILAWLRENMPDCETKVNAIAKEYGHCVVMLPPYRPELNAIETAWGVAKNHVATNNNPQVTFSGLNFVIEQGLKKVTLDTWSKLNSKVVEEEKRQLNNLEVEEARRRRFREEHPDLIFRLESDSDSESDEEEDAGVEDTDLLAAIGDGLGGDDIPLEDFNMQVSDNAPGEVVTCEGTESNLTSAVQPSIHRVDLSDRVPNISPEVHSPDVTDVTLGLGIARQVSNVPYGMGLSHQPTPSTIEEQLPVQISNIHPEAALRGPVSSQFSIPERFPQNEVVAVEMLLSLRNVNNVEE